MLIYGPALLDGKHHRHRWRGWPILAKLSRSLRRADVTPKILIALKEEVSDLPLLIEGTLDLAREHESVTTKPLNPMAL